MRRKKSFWVMGILIGTLLLSSALPLLADEEKKDLDIQPQKVIVTPKEPEQGKGSLRAILKIIVSPNPSFKVKVWIDKAEGATYYAGEKLTIYFQSTRNCYLTLLDFTPEGEVHQIFPNRWHRDNYVRAGKTYRIPAPGDGFEFTIKGPPGEEIIKAIATTTDRRLTPGEVNYEEGFPLISKSGKNFAFELKVIVKPIPPKQWAADTCYFYVAERVRPITGRIRVESEPSFAKIYLDGRYEGRTNKTIPSVTPGRYTIKVTKPGFSDWLRTIYVREGETVNLFAELKPYPLYGSIYITSTPWDARVFIDGVEKGETPLSIEEVEIGWHEITLIKKYYHAWTKDVYVGEEEVRLDVDLEPISYKGR